MRLNSPALYSPAVQRRPELSVFRSFSLFVVDEHPVVLAPDFFESIPHRAQTILVGRDDRAVQIELDNGFRATDRFGFSRILQVQQPRSTAIPAPPLSGATVRSKARPPIRIVARCTPANPSSILR